MSTIGGMKLNDALRRAQELGFRVSPPGRTGHLKVSKPGVRTLFVHVAKDAPSRLLTLIRQAERAHVCKEAP